MRIEKKLTQKQLAEAISISESYYCQLENGSRRMSLPVAQKIALALGVLMDDIFMPANLADSKDNLGGLGQ